MIYEGTGAPGPCQPKDRSSVAIAPSAPLFALCLDRAGGPGGAAGAAGLEVSGGQLGGSLTECFGAMAGPGPVHLQHR